MKKYNEMVRDFADQKSEDLIPNSGLEHAEVLVKNIFSHASNEVRIFTGRLNPSVYGTPEVIKSITGFLHDGTDRKIKILLQDIDPNKLGDFKKNHLYKLCKEWPDSCEIKTTDSELQSHFVVMDDNGYRIEPDKSEPVGIGCFNDKDLSERLVTLFDGLFTTGTVLNHQA